MKICRVSAIIIAMGAMLFSAGAVQAQIGKLLMTEAVITPTAGEMVEIFNPTGSGIDLTDIYLTDATFAGGSTYYYQVVTGGGGGGGFGDWHARFPDGAFIGPGRFRRFP